jgi:hypothetical protein
LKSMAMNALKNHKMGLAIVIETTITNNSTLY